MKNNTFTRRTFIQGLGLATAGLSLGIFGGSAYSEDRLPQSTSTDALLKPNVFVHIDSTGLVTYVCHRSEMGQGIRSSLPYLIADELGADMAKVKILQADGDKVYGDQNTDGSKSIRSIYFKMRQVAATAREMMIEVAAKKWKVSKDQCFAENNFIHLKNTHKKFSFGELVEEASLLPVPALETVKLRADKELKRVGKDLPLIDGIDYTNGKIIFGADVKIPGMLIATIARPPVSGGKIKKLDDKKALKIPGVKKILRMPEPKEPFHFQPWGGVAVIAENTWAAIQGREALEITWDHGKNKVYNSVEYRKALEKSSSSQGSVVRKLGDVEEAFKNCEKIIEADYYVPHLPHAPMEPPVCLAHYKKEEGTCEIWVPSQNPQAARTEAARVLGISEDKVTVHVTFLGGGFGRKSKADFTSEAAHISKEINAPVRVQWTREDDIHNDYLNTVNSQKFLAGIDKKGKVIAWKHRTAFPPIRSVFDDKVNVANISDLNQGVADMALNIPNIQTEACEAEHHLRIGWLRSVYNIFHAFGTHSFLDEIAHTLKKDPRDFLLEIFRDEKSLSPKDLGVESVANHGASLEEHPVNPHRLREVIKKVTEVSGWKDRKKFKNRSFGLAAHRSFLSYVGVVASVTKGKNNELWVDEVWICIDAGIVINTERVRAQMEGSVMNGITYLKYGGVTHKDGAVEQSNFDGVKLLMMPEIPRKIHVEIINSKELPGGVGEPGLPPVAPAVANAIFALTGKRLREFASKDFI